MSLSSSRRDGPFGPLSRRGQNITAATATTAIGPASFGYQPAWDAIRYNATEDETDNEGSVHGRASSG